jgi:hypothetical protein
MSDLADVIHLPDDDPLWATWSEALTLPFGLPPLRDDDPPIC